MVRKRSWPAVSHCDDCQHSRPDAAFCSVRTICSFTVLPSSSIVRIFWGLLDYRRPGLQVRGTTHKVDTDGRDVALGVCVVGETEEQARLSDTRVTDEEELEEVVVSVEASRQREPCMARRAAPGLLSMAKSNSAGLHVSTVAPPDLAALFPGLWRWASRGGYVPLRVHDGGVAGVERGKRLRDVSWGWSEAVVVGYRGSSRGTVLSRG